MNSKNVEYKKNQPARFAKIVILLTPFIVAAAGATLYQESKSHSPKVTTSTYAAPSDVGTEEVDSGMVGEPFSKADGVNFTSVETAPMTGSRANAPALASVPTRAQAHSAVERQYMYSRFDHSVVNQHATAHDSDYPGGSIAAY